MLKELCTVRNLTIIATLTLSVGCWLTGNWVAGVSLNALAVNLMMLWTK